MSNTNEFSLNIWGLHLLDKSTYDWFQYAYRHDLDGLINLYPEIDFTNIDNLINPVHLFACGMQRNGGLYHSRKCLEWLLENGGKLDMLDASNWLPINYAAWFGQASTMDVLLEMGSPVQNPTSPQPLDTALVSISQNSPSSPQGSETCARLLLMHGANPNMGLASDPCYGGVTWLTWALENERLDWAQCLWSAGLNSVSDKEMSLIVLRANFKSLRWLQEKKIDILKWIDASHPFYNDLLLARAHDDKKALIDGLACGIDKDDLSDDDKKGGGGKKRGKRKI